jgi:uncharacterized protein (TIGR02597 family)
MKTLSLSIFAAAAACGFASAQTAFTTPVGYVSLGNTTGVNAVPANTDVAVSVPLLREAEFTGVISSTTANTITLAGTPWVDGQWASPGTPYLVTITSGAENGFTALVTANNTSTLTVSPVTSGNLASATGSIQIHKAWTLISLLPSGTVPTGTRVLAYSGTVVGENLAANLVYVWTGTQWTQLVGGSGLANSTILYPGEAFIVRAAASPVPKLVIAGTVPVSNSRLDIVKLAAPNQDNRVAFISPVDEVIGQSGLGLLAFNNETTGINKAANEVLVWTGSAWTGLVGVSGNQTNTYTLKAGRGYVYRRVASAPSASVVDWNNQPSFLPLP